MTEPHETPNWPDDDPIVAEVRANREAIAAAVNYDLQALVARLRQLEATERAKGRTILAPPDSGAAA
jgi:hypothetical protein